MAPPDAYKANSASSSMTILDTKSKKRKGLSTREKIFILLGLCLLAAVIVLTVLFVKEKQQKEKQDYADEHCTTEDCIGAASRMINAMNTEEFDPCEDFYEYSCNGWIKRNLIPEDRGRYGTFSLLRDELQAELKDLLENTDYSKDTDSTKKAKTLYEACVNETILDDIDGQPLKDYIQQLFGEWPLLTNNWQESSFDLRVYLKKLKQFNVSPLISFYAGPDDRNSTHSVVLMDQASLGLPNRDYFLDSDKEKERQAYRTYILDLANMLLGSAQKPWQLETDVDNFIKFETEIAKITIRGEDRRNQTALYNPMALNDIATKYRNLPVSELLKESFKEIGDVELADNERVLNRVPSYFAELDKLLPTISKRDQANYLVWRFIKTQVPELSKNYRSAEQKYRKVIYGPAQERARWRVCVDKANDHLEMAVGRLYVQRSFSEESKATAKEMIDGISKAFKDLLEENNWMDDDARKSAATKANKISERIGYPDYVLNDVPKLDKEYERMTFASSEHLKNIIETRKHQAWLSLEDLRRPVDKSRWYSSPAVVNAFYSAAKNSITFPAGILQPPFYHAGQPKAMNYGGIGAVIGHEITHGFDDQGRQYDGDGNLRDWWNPDVVERFEERAKCIIDQYGNYVDESTGKALNGNKTQGENIADNGGLVQAYRAYREWVAERGREERKLPGLKYTPNQLFFINYAQIWCGSYRKSTALHQITTGVHSLSRFRVIGTLSNTREFSEAFQCKPGSRMNPEEKCKVW